MKKNLLIFGALAALLLAGAALLGVRHASAPTQPMKQYSSGALSFEYPAQYALQVHEGGYAGRQVTTLTLIDSSVHVPDMSDGPASISILMTPQGTTTDISQWVRENSISNFGGLSADGSLAPAAVGGEPAVSYQYSGLYETDAYAAAHGGMMYLFFGSWAAQDDPMREDFRNVVKSVTFK